MEELTLNDAGRYTCVAENGAGHAETHFDIEVTSRFHSEWSSSIYFSLGYFCSSTCAERFVVAREVISVDQQLTESCLCGERISSALNRLDVQSDELSKNGTRTRVDYKSCSSAKRNVERVKELSRCSFSLN